MTVSGSRKRLLLVDDYPDALEMWAAFFNASGYDVVTASSGRQALERALADVPDLILLDLQLPEISGIEVARRLRSSTQTAHVPLIAVTGFSQERDHEAARRAGFDTIVVKPCDPPALLDEITRLLSPPEAPEDSDAEIGRGDRPPHADGDERASPMPAEQRIDELQKQ